MDQRSLEAAAKSGNIDLLYELIHEDPYVLDKIHDVPFVNTPLHVAAVAGNTEFAMEIMNLKPSFSRKLNADGLTPLHLAVDHGHSWFVLELLKVDPSLVRVKGRHDMTPLLVAVNKKKIDLISEFFLVCPESIVDANVNGENALHIALNNCDDQIEGLIVLKVLMGWILRLCQKDAEGIETRVINRRDKDGNTPLHLAAYEKNRQAMEFMFESSNINVNIENKNGFTVLDIVALHSNSEIERMVKRHGGKRSVSLVKLKTTSDLLASNLSCRESRKTKEIRFYSWMSEERKNALLVVAALIVTATYQTVLQPPGGLSDGGGQNDGTSRFESGFSGGGQNDTKTSSQKAGSVVMHDGIFIEIWIWNSVGFFFALHMMMRMLSLGKESTFWHAPLFVPLLLAYVVAGKVITPNETSFTIANGLTVVVILIWNLWHYFWEWLQAKRSKARGPKSGLVWEGFTSLDQAKGVTPNRFVIR